MKGIWEWLLWLFGLTPVKIPDHIIKETTAYVNPKKFKPKKVDE